MDWMMVKHFVATSRLAPFAGRIRAWRSVAHLVRHPELGLLRSEERMLENVIAAHIQPGAHCVDVGAHIGSMSYIMQQKNAGGPLTIIEALPRKAELLSQRFAAATVHAVAVSDQTGEVQFFENIDSPGFSSMADRASRGRTRQITVPSKRLDDLLSAGPKVDFIKIDVEGFEYEALIGAEQVIRRDQPDILFESGARGDADISDERSRQVFRLLSEHFDYDVRALFDVEFGRPAIDLKTFESYRTYPFLAFNFLATPRAQAARPLTP